MATRTPSPAQLAARARFAEMARNGSLNRKRQIAAKKSAGVKRKTNPTSDVKWDNYLYGPPKGIIGTVDGAQVLIFPIKKSETDEYDMPEWARAVVEILPSKTHEEAHFPAGSVQNGKDNAHRFVANAKIGRKSNPAKKTVSQKVSQLVHEGYPQRQAVAVALNEQRAGKVKSNPGKSKYADFKYCVEAHRYGAEYVPMAYFAVKAQAQDYINALKKTHPSVTLRIKTHK